MIWSFVAPVINNLVTVAQEDSLLWICDYVVNIDKNLLTSCLMFSYKLTMIYMCEIRIYILYSESNAWIVEQWLV